MTKRPAAAEVLTLLRAILARIVLLDANLERIVDHLTEPRRGGHNPNGGRE